MKMHLQGVVVGLLAIACPAVALADTAVFTPFTANVYLDATDDGNFESIQRGDLDTVSARGFTSPNLPYEATELFFDLSSLLGLDVTSATLTLDVVGTTTDSTVGITSAINSTTLFNLPFVGTPQGTYATDDDDSPLGVVTIDLLSPTALVPSAATLITSLTLYANPEANVQFAGPGGSFGLRTPPTLTIEFTAIPEPTTAGLLLALTPLALRRRRA